MPCYRPIQGWKGRVRTPNGKRPIVFNVNQGFEDLSVTVPCGQCVGCRLEHSRQWAIRCMHEASLHKDNCFITLTYDDAHLPHGGTLVKRHWQTFMKRLRKNTGAKIRYYHAGEYGKKERRPHYHAILFGFDFKDKRFYKKSLTGHPLFISDTLFRTWNRGWADIGSVTFQSAAYVARYVMKKFTNADEEEVAWHYRNVDAITGESHDLEPEYATMSRRPGIAREWFDKYGAEVYTHDSVIVNGREAKPPKYYDTLMERTDPDEIRDIKVARRKAAGKHAANQTTDRLMVREEVKSAQLRHLRRPIGD